MQSSLSLCLPSHNRLAGRIYTAYSFLARRAATDRTEDGPGVRGGTWPAVLRGYGTTGEEKRRDGDIFTVT